MLELDPTRPAQGADHDPLPARGRSRPPAGFRGRVEVLDAADAPSRARGALPDRRDHRRRARRHLRSTAAAASSAASACAPPPTASRSPRATRPPRARAGAGRRRRSDARPEPPRETLGEQAPALRRSIHVRHIDCGSDGSEEWEIQALWNPYYDIQRLGFFLTAAPRHADVLLVTGAVTDPMREPARAHLGGDARTQGAGRGRHRRVLRRAAPPTAGSPPAASTRCCRSTSTCPGSPPAPIAIMHGLLLAAGLLDAGRGGGMTARVRDRDGRAGARAAARLLARPRRATGGGAVLGGRLRAAGDRRDRRGARGAQPDARPRRLARVRAQRAARRRARRHLPRADRRHRRARCRSRTPSCPPGAG